MVERVCGTGGWNGPKPGDPDSNNLILSATPAFGGIDINWTFPLINPEAVAYTMLFRSLLANPDTKQLLANVGGSFYYDKTTVDINTVYYYWIQVVSVNGTVGELIGPAWARARPLIGDLIEQLTGEIDAGVLAQSLKVGIDQIKLNTLAITQEMIDRDAADQTYGVMLNEISGQMGENRALLQQEVLARVTADQSFVSTVNTLYANFNTSIAAIQVQTKALATADKALADQITTVQSKMGSDLASVQVSLSTNINLLGQKVTSIGALWTAKVDVNGLIGGFGVYNDGRIVDAGFDVDRFWIGRTGINRRKPFIVLNGETFIDQAVIYSLTFSKLRDEAGSVIVENGRLKADYIKVEDIVAGSAKSSNYSPNARGWFFNPNGQIDINGSSPDGSRMSFTEKCLAWYWPNGNLMMRIGSW